MGNLPKKIRIVYFLFFLFVFIVVIPGLLLYANGYSLDKTFKLVRNGGIYVYVSESGASVFIGDTIQATTGLFSREILLKNLKPEKYLVLVSHDDFWPWAKFVDVKQGEVSARFPLMVPKIMSFKDISKNSPEYNTTALLFATSTSPTTAINRNLKVSAERNIISADWLAATNTVPYYFCEERVCSKNVRVFSGSSNIKRLGFYPGRDDAIILTFGNGVYALEVDTSPYQNIYPIFRGKNPDVRIEGNILYVKDDDYLAKTEL